MALTFFYSLEQTPIFGVNIMKAVLAGKSFYSAERGWFQDDLADAARLHRTYIGTVERAEQSITLDSVENIAKAFKVPIKRLFEE